jgi:hypothetical protein
VRSAGEGGHKRIAGPLTFALFPRGKGMVPVSSVLIAKFVSFCGQGGTNFAI